ncbi:IS481 family transposase, partial [Glutamicibacter sp. V16R2B1]
MSYITHARASLTPQGRLKMVLLVINEKWTQARVAERFQV